jgi:hypothetical protein
VISFADTMRMVTARLEFVMQSVSSPSLRRHYPDQVRGFALRLQLCWNHPERHLNVTPAGGASQGMLVVAHVESDG